MKNRILNFLLKYWAVTFSQFVIAHWPFLVTTRVDKFKSVFIKKGKIIEWRTYSEKGERIVPPMLGDYPAKRQYP